ncbi:MAG: family 10 glycosylhydrolase [Victivallaceae bacterium]|nr:family 10 glycosylhydrolase [Victivallaceae bacterium]
MKKNRMFKLIMLVMILGGTVKATAANWHSDTYVIWAQKKDAPHQATVVSWSDWLVFGNAVSGKPGVRFLINTLGAAGIREVWWRTFGGGNTLYSSKVPDVTNGNYAGQGADYGKYDSLKDAVEYAHKLGIKISAWYTPLEEAHGWADNVRSRYTDLHKDMWDRNIAGMPTGAPSMYYKKYRDYKLALAKEMLYCYNIDGIVIDFERLGGPVRSDLWGYLPPMVNGFNKHYKRSGKPATNDPEWQAYRAEYVGKFMRGVKKLAEERKRPAEMTVIFPAGKDLTAHWDIARWHKEKIIDRLGLIKHGSKWAAPAPNLAEVEKQYQKSYKLPISVILYSLQGSNQEVKYCLDRAIAGGVKNIIWFETTYLYFKHRYALPTAAACPERIKLSSPEYDFSTGGKLELVAAGDWKISVAEKVIAEGKANQPYHIKVPRIASRNRLQIECTLSGNTPKAGIAIQGLIGTTQVHSNAQWISSQGQVITLAQPGIPPFLAPLDTAIAGGVK